jgi:outer membrane protein OmpA-like peptidoglycan-associated protein
MVKGGIPASRITSAGYGQENPVAQNDTEQGRAKNRRLELVVLKR